MLNEGIIEVPERLLNECLMEVYNFYVRYIYDYLPDRLAFEQLSYDGQSLHVPSSDYRLIGIKNDQYVMTTIDYHHEEIKYSDKKGKATFNLGVTLADKGKTLGAYSENYNAIILFLKKYTEMMDEQSMVFDENYFNSSEEERKDIVDMFDMERDVERYIKQLLRDVKSTIHHELAHMIQYQYLKDKDPKQVQGGTETMKDYLTGQVEFSPHIISAIDDYETFVTDVDKIGHTQYRKDVLKIITAISNKTLIYYDDYTGESPKSVSESSYRMNYISPNRTFFEMLKSENPKQYKKAVKYFYDEVKKRGLI